MPVNPYTSEDFAAFLIYAGPPPSQLPANEQRLHSGALQFRLDYVGKCDDFCAEYFTQLCKSAEPLDPPEWVEFYQEFISWYKIRQEMSDEMSPERSPLLTDRQDSGHE